MRRTRKSNLLAAVSRSEPLDSRRLGGLSSAEASARMRKDGANEIPSARRRSLLWLARDVLREPMILLLVSCSAIYLALGDLREAIVLSLSVLVVIGITFFQNRKTERALEALRDLSSPRALVIRDGESRRIAGREVVRGDLIVVSEGDRVPADGERPLGIEPLRRRVAPDRRVRPGLQTRGPGGRASRPAQPERRVFSGTLVVAGQGLARVTATGPGTEMGRIGKSLGTIELEETPLQREMGRIVLRLAAIGARPLPPRGPSLRAIAGESLRRAARRSGARDVHPAGGVPRRADDLPRARSLAALAQEGADAPGPRDRGARRRDGALRRQDRYPDGQPDERDPPRRRRTAPGCRRKRDASRRVSRARGVRGPREPEDALRPDGAGDPRARPAHARPHRAPPRGLGASARVSSLARTARRLARLEGPRAGGVRDRGQGGAGGDRRPLPPRGRGDTTGSSLRSRSWQARGCASSRWPGPAFEDRRCRTTSTIIPSSSWASWASRIPCAHRSRRPFAIARLRESGSS